MIHVSPESPWWIAAGAMLILVMHIAGGAIGLLSGTVALIARKGSHRHRLAGRIFIVSMLVMAAIGASVSPFLGQGINVIAGTFTFYLVVTAWLTVKRRGGETGVAEIIALAVALGAVAASVTLGMFGTARPRGIIAGYPAAAYFVVAAIVALAAALDLKVILHGGITGAPRIARHIWRMCVALFIAAASFFLGQQKIMSVSIRGSFFLIVPPLAVLAVMLFWLVRVRITRGRGMAVQR
ncbi:MAG: hypothetical protein ABI810_13740 [Sphingomonas bacterium]